MRAYLIAAAGLIAWAAWEASKDQSFADAAINDIQDTANVITKTITGWNTDLVPVQYREAISAAEASYDLPSGMLARLLWQESRYRDDIITGRKRSPVGALGIAQFMPATAAQLQIDPLEPFQAIPAAARYLSSLFRQTGDWAKALAAYNWGIGNVQRKGLSAAPAETVAYYSNILNDVGLA